MSDVYIPRRRDLAAETAPPRPSRWHRWAEQQFAAGWRLRIDHAGRRACWERAAHRMAISYATACRVEAVLGTEPVPYQMPDVRLAHTRPTPVTEVIDGVRVSGMEYVDAETGRAIRCSYPPEVVAAMLRLYREGATSAEITAAGVPYGTVYQWACALGIERGRRRVPESAAAPSWLNVPPGGVLHVRLISRREVRQQPLPPPSGCTRYVDEQTGEALYVRCAHDTVRRALALLREGRPLREVADAAGVSRSALCSWQRRLGMTYPPLPS